MLDRSRWVNENIASVSEVETTVKRPTTPWLVCLLQRVHSRKTQLSPPSESARQLWTSTRPPRLGTRDLQLHTESAAVDVMSAIIGGQGAWIQGDSC